MKKHAYIVLYILLAIAVVTGGFAILKRIRVEASNNSVEIAMDWQDIRKMSLAEGVKTDDLLKLLKASGLTSVALTEDTLETLDRDGKIAWLTGYEQKTLMQISKNKRLKGKMSERARSLAKPFVKSVFRGARLNPSLSYVFSDNKALLDRIESQLSITLGKGQVKRISMGSPSSEALEITDFEEDLINVGVGISPELFRDLTLKGFYVVPRIKNNYRFNAAVFTKKLNDIKKCGPFSVVVFDGEEVGGFKSNVVSVAKALRRSGINFGYVEMAGQKGDSEFLKTMKTSIIRVHSISEDEMADKMTRKEAIERFDRAIIERGVRLAFIRPFYMPDNGLTLIQTNANYVSDIKKLALSSGHTLGQATVPDNISIGMRPLLLLSLGVCAGLLLLLSAFFEIPTWLVYLALAIAIYVPVQLRILYHILLFRKIAALAAAIIFPSLAITWVFRKEEKEVVIPFSRAVLMTLASFAISFAGAALIVGLLSDTRFMLGSEQFMGIKFAFILPVLITALYCMVIEKEALLSFKDTFIEWMNSPITVLNVLVAIVLTGAAAMYIIRSGNFGIGVLDSEKMARGVLQNVMMVRPRTKEFLLGYPLIFLGAAYFLKGGRKWLWPFLIIGIVAPISTINSFCHVHSPIMISTLRSIYGVILGIGVGALVYGGYLLGMKFAKK